MRDTRCVEESRHSEANIIDEAQPAEPSMFPLSFAQQRLWFLDQLEPHLTVYNVTFPARIRGKLDAQALRQAMQIIVDRHEPLRTTFTKIDSQPMQVIAPAVVVQLPVIDLTLRPKTEQEAEALRILQQGAQTPFNLEKDLLLRTKLLRLDTEEHIFALETHHIVSDGWSISIFYNELQQVYDSLIKGEQSPLPALEIQYADFSVWQRDWLQGDVLEEQLAFWRQCLQGAPALIELPIDHPRPSVQTYRGARISVSWPRSLTESLKAISKKEGSTLYMALLGGLQATMSRYTGLTDIVVGSPIANRNRLEIEGLIGYFANTLALRTDLSGDPTFREILHRVRDITIGAYTHQDVPFEKLVEELRPVRDRSYSPLFQTMFVLQNTPAHPNPGSITFEPFEVENGTAKVDLNISLTETGDGLMGCCEYASDLFEAPTVQQFILHWRTLLEAAAENPDIPLSQLPLLAKQERTRILREWNNTTTEYPTHACLNELVEQQVARTPDAVAVEFNGASLSYRELDERANGLAHELRSLGVGPEILVGLCIERSLEMVVSLLAILKTGGAYLPLDPNYPKDRLEFIVHDSHIQFLVTTKSLVTRLPVKDGQGPRIIFADHNQRSTGNPTPSQSGTSSQNLAYVLYTSGSTGKPKGVQIPHRAVVNFLRAMQQSPGITSKDTLLAVTTLSFDIAGLELFLPLIVGAKVIITDTATAADGKRLSEKISLHKVTMMQATPATWRLLLEAGWQGNRQMKLLCGGEAWGEELARQLLPRCESLWNMYGPTETTIWSAATKVEPSQVPSIGIPIANTQFYVLDPRLNPVPIGVAGELHIGGDGLARGYLQRPELTAEKFIHNPFTPETASRIYKTGDLVRYRPNGHIEFLGRLDHQVKIRGFRIELGEIQSLLAQHAEIAEVVVVAREDIPGDKRIVAYVVAKHSAIPVDELRQFLKQKLPEYMLPSAFMFLDRLPTTPNGKVDRKALPAPESSRSATQFVAARDPLELQLTKLWEQIFKISPIGIRDNFFELGGHSLLAVKLFADIEKITGTNLPLVTLFQAPTIEGLAAILRKQGWEAPWSSLVAIKPGGSKPPFFCVHGVGGNILEYLDLAKYMEEDQPFYGLQAVGLDGKRPWLKTVEEMASHYIKEIQEFQPQGPYYIGGSSFGGIVAFEMAQQLCQRGEQIALLAFFDTYAPGYPKFVPPSSAWRHQLERLSFRLSLHWGNFVAARRRDRFLYIWTKVKKWCNGQYALLRKAKRKWRRRAEERALPKAIREAQQTGQTAHATYRPVKYKGDATLFRATVQIVGTLPHPTLGWGDFIEGNIDVFDTPGHHGSIVRDPRARVLAEQLKESLQKARLHTEAQNKQPSTAGPTIHSPGGDSKVSKRSK